MRKSIDGITKNDRTAYSTEMSAQKMKAVCGGWYNHMATQKQMSLQWQREFYH